MDAAVEELGRLPDGTVDVPRQWQQVGWYAEGPRPGEAGPAVLLGHVDSKAGPAVFYRLRELRPGDRVEVVTATGAALGFVVRRVARYPKDEFPTDEVYLPTLRREVRLVTCGGTFDRGSGHYRDNVIAFAEAA
ncbi:MAG: peptidase sortase [Frankiales bacterium]|nr:peptidase sortase [Frankiales bacterium]